MTDQIIVTISREFGSGGHEIAVKLAEKLGISMYDRNMLEEIAKEKNIDSEEFHSWDEKKGNPLLTRRIGEHTNSWEHHVANMQFDYLRERAAAGESFVAVGRCAETVLKDNKNLVSVFVLGDSEEKKRRVMECYHLDEAAAMTKMKRHDRTRKQYHNQYSDFKWGTSRGYDLCINSSKTGVEQCADLIEFYVKQRVKQAVY